MSKAIAALNWAKTKIGAAYSQANRWASNTFDCSSFVYRAYQAAGVSMVHKDTGAAVSTSTSEVYAKDFTLLWPSTYEAVGQSLPSPSSLLGSLGLVEGDLIFYNHTTTSRPNNITHVSMYAGDGQIIHARNTQLGVRYDPVTYMQTNVCAVTRLASSGTWQKTNGKWSYLVDGTAVTGWQQITWSQGTSWFLFGDDGIMLTGWQMVGNLWYYMDPETGAMKTGWIKSSGNDYYLKTSGAMATSAAVLGAGGAKVWLLGADGIMQPDAVPLVK